MRRSPRPPAGAALPVRYAALLSLLLAVLLPALVAPASASETPTPTATATPTPTPAEEPEPTAPPAPPAPLRVVLHRLRPAVLPEDPDHEVVVDGTVTNPSDEVWSDLNAYLLSSSEPMTSAEELAAAVASDPTSDIGSRIVEPGLFADLPDLEPGDSARFRLSVPRRAFDVTGDPGVYWLGVHVLGTPEDGERDLAADGRTRTFLPLVPRDTEGTELAVAAQFRAQVVREPDGRLTRPAPLARRLTHDGRLQRLLALSRTADPGTLSWVVDPAVVEAVASLAEGNPAYDAQRSALPTLDGGTAAGSNSTGTGSSGGTGNDGSGSGPGDGSGGSDGSGGGKGAGGSADDDGATDPVARRAARWLAGWASEASRHEVLAVPYGDLDVAAAYSNARAALSTYALDVSTRVLGALGVTAEPVVAPPNGYLPANALTALPADVLTVLGPQAVPSLPRPLVETGTGTTALLAGTAETTRGPSPGAPRAALAVRQRLLAESALHALSADRRQPMVTLLPSWWDPGPRWRDAHFLQGLDQPWLRLVDVAEVRRDARAAQLSLPEGLVYPEEAAAAELASYVLEDTSDLITKGATYESVFIDVESVGDRLGRQALLSSAYWSRTHPRLAAERARTAGALVDSLLDRVTVRGPTFVTLSSEDGDFLVTLANGLRERIRVGLQATVTGPGLQLTTPDAVTLEPNERRSVRIAVRSSGIGIHRVFLQPTTDTGLPVGRSVPLSVRSSSVGLVLWVVMAGGSAVLFGAIAVRIARRVRRRRATHGPVLRDAATGQPEGVG